MDNGLSLCDGGKFEKERARDSKESSSLLISRAILQRPEQDSKRDTQLNTQMGHDQRTSYPWSVDITRPNPRRKSLVGNLAYFGRWAMARRSTGLTDGQSPPSFPPFPPKMRSRIVVTRVRESGLFIAIRPERMGEGRGGSDLWRVRAEGKTGGETAI